MTPPRAAIHQKAENSDPEEKFPQSHPPRKKENTDPTAEATGKKDMSPKTMAEVMVKGAVITTVRIAADTVRAGITETVRVMETTVKEENEEVTVKAVRAMGRAEAMETDRQTERDGRVIGKAVRATGRAEAMETDRQTERDGRVIGKAVRATGRAEVTETDRQTERDDRVIGKAVLATGRAEATETDRTTAMARKAEKEGRTAGDPPATGISVINPAFPEALPVPAPGDSIAATKRISRKPTRLESTGCFRGNRRSTVPRIETMTWYPRRFKKKSTSTNSSRIPESAPAARPIIISRPVS